MKRAQNLCTTFDRELLNRGLMDELFFDEETTLTSPYEVEGADELLDEMAFTDFMEMTDEGLTLKDIECESYNAPLYFKSVSKENTGSHLDPYGA